MNKKRGLFLVALVILLSTLILGQEQSILNEKEYVSWQIGCMCDSVWDEDDMLCDSDNTNYVPDRELRCEFLEENKKIDYTTLFPDILKEDENDCGTDYARELKSSVKKPADQGCWVFAVEEDLGDDECAYAKVHEGVILSGEKNTDLDAEWDFYELISFESGDHVTSWGPFGELLYPGASGALGTAVRGSEDPHELIKLPNFALETSYSYLCSDDHYWHECNEEEGGEGATQKTVTWANNKLYNCTLEEDTEFPIWQEQPGEDKDHDFVTTKQNDCDDTDPDELPERLAFCKDATVDDCTILENSVCPICIKPEALEVAGDGVDNNCDGIIVTDPDEDKDTRENDAQNTYKGGFFSWLTISGNEEAQCCGDDGITDFGVIARGTYQQGSEDDYICLKKVENIIKNYT